MAATIINPTDPTPVLRAPRGRPTDTELEQLREHIKALQSSKTEGVGPFYTWANGLDEMTKALMAGVGRNKLNSLASQAQNYDLDLREKEANAGLPGEGGPAPRPLFQRPPKGALAMLEGLPQPDTETPTSATSTSPMSTSNQPQLSPKEKLDLLSSPQLDPSLGPEAKLGQPTGSIPTGGSDLGPLLDDGTPKSAAAALLGPNSRVAQAYPSNVLTRSPRDWNRALRDSYFYGSVGQAAKGASAAEEAIGAQRARRGIEGIMPQYGVDDFGRITVTQPGKPPMIEGYMPGHPGKLNSLFGGAAQGRTYFDRNGNLRYQEVPLEEAPDTGPRSEIPNTTGPDTATGVAGATTAPSIKNNAPVAPKTLLGATAPSNYENQPPAVRVASLTNDATPVPISANHPAGLDFGPKGTQIAQALPSSSDEIGKDTIQKYMDEADKNAYDPTKNVKKIPIAPGRTFEARQKAQEKYVEEQNKVQTESNQKYFDYVRNLSRIGRKLQPDFALAKNVIDDPTMVFGKGAQLETSIRNMKGELADLLERNGYKDQAVKVRSATYSPSASEVYSKLMAGIVLQNLRSYLGENSGQFRVFELQLLQQAFGQGSMSKEANKAIINLASNINDRAILVGNLAEKYATKHNGIDSSFIQQMENLESDHPVYQPEKIMDIIRGGNKPEDKFKDYKIESK